MRRIASLCLAFLAFVSVFLPMRLTDAQYIKGSTTKVDYDNTDPKRYTIDIDLTNQIITVTDNYSKEIVKQGLCTTGASQTPTSSGIYEMGDLKERFGYFVAYGQYAQYWSQIVRGIYIHSVMYTSKDPSSMVRSAYNNLGSARSHGCVRTMPDMAQFIFYNCPPKTICVVKRHSRDAALVARLREEKPSFSNYVQPIDNKAYPLEIPGTVRYDNTPIRNGFNNTTDRTIGHLDANTNVMLTQIGSLWCKVRTSRGKQGYVKTQNLLFYPDKKAVIRSGYTAAGNVYIYSLPTTSSKLLAKVPDSVPLNYTAPYNDDWCLVEYNDIIGHTRLDQLKFGPIIEYPSLSDYDTVYAKDSSSAASAVPENGARVRDGVVAGLRSGASINYPVIAELSEKTKIRIISSAGSWYYCEANSIVGYLHATCIFY